MHRGQGRVRIQVEYRAKRPNISALIGKIKDEADG